MEALETHNLDTTYVVVRWVVEVSLLHALVLEVPEDAQIGGESHQHLSWGEHGAIMIMILQQGSA